MIAASHLSRRFGGRMAVDDVSLEVGASEIVALLGPNGAGKTTTMRMLAGLIGATSGMVTIGGVRLTRATGSALRRRIGFLTEAPGLWDRLSVRENLLVYAGLYEIDRSAATIDELLEVLGLTQHATARAAELSKGMRQKVAIARALLHRPDVLLLDEPTAGLDPEISREVRGLLEERRAAGCAILVSTHNLHEAEQLADRVAVLHQRLLALDTPSVLRRRLTTGRLVIRVVQHAAAHLGVGRQFDPQATAENDLMTVTLADVDRDTPALVRALVAAGAEVREVRPEMPALEDVYLHLVTERAPAEGISA
jgi:ABC-2 type transport system ATP-binding protein